MDSEKDDRVLAGQIKKALDTADSRMSVRTPDMNVFRAMVKQAAREKEKRMKRELAVFISVAAVILGMEIYSFHRSITVFITVQTLAISIIPAAGLLLWYLKRYRRVKADD